MGFLGFGNYSKPGPGVNKDEPPKAAPVRFFEVFFRKFSKLVQLNLIFLLPTLVVALLMAALYFFPTHFIMQLPTGEGAMQLDIWAVFVTPMPLILLFPFVAGLTFVCRNFAREEHAFVWSDFWDAVRGNWKYFLLNGLVCYLVYVMVGFSLTYYYNMAAGTPVFYVLFLLCMALAILFVFAQFYLPVMFVTFDLKFAQAYKNAFILSLAGLGRNLLLAVIIGGLGYIAFNVVPVTGLTAFIFLVLLVFILFSFFAFLINFTVYPLIDRYLIKPYTQRQAAQEEAAAAGGDSAVDFSGLFAQQTDEDEDDGEDKMVYVNGKLVRRSEIKKD